MITDPGKPPILFKNDSHTKFTHYIKPMLAKLHEGAFDDPGCIYEIKWDGYRAIAEAGKGKPKLYSRNGLSFEDDYPPVFEELQKIKKNVVLDGEIVAMDAKGMPSFQLIQQYLQNHDVPVCYYVFDCLYVNGKSIEKKPLAERKEILRSVLPQSDFIKYCDHVDGKGKEFFAALKRKGLEGMIAKRKDSVYTEGKRSSDWLKVKHVLMEEAIIAGYTEPRGGRKYFGALILATYDHGKLKYIGHTGTGFTEQILKDVYNKLQPLKISKSPFDTEIQVNAPVTWVKPKLVCNLKYTEVTKGGSRRHPVFMGLRIDKEAKDVRPEVADKITRRKTIGKRK